MSRAVLGASCGRLGSVSGQSWAVVGRLVSFSNASLGVLWASWARVGALLACHEASWDVLGASWGRLGPSLGLLARLGTSWVVLGQLSGLGTPFWFPLVLYFFPFGPHFVPFGSHLAFSSSP